MAIRKYGTSSIIEAFADVFSGYMVLDKEGLASVTLEQVKVFSKLGIPTRDSMELMSEVHHDLRKTE